MGYKRLLDDEIALDRQRLTVFIPEPRWLQSTFDINVGSSGIEYFFTHEMNLMLERQ